MNVTRTLTWLVVASTILAACSATGGSLATTSAPAGAARSSAAGGATVMTATTPTYGLILTGANGLALYTYDADAPGTSACSGGCASAWPPLTVPAGQQPSAGPGVTGALTTLTRADGTTQVAFDGMPLYSWPGDSMPGEVTGDGVNGFSVAKPTGGTTPPAGSAAPSSTGGRYGY